MTIAFVQKATGSSSAGTNVATTLTGVTAGNTLILVIGYNDTSASSSALTVPSGWTAAINPAPQVSAGNGSDGVAIFYKLNAPAGSNSVTVNSLGGGATLYSITALAEFSGIATSNVVDQTSSAGSAAAASTTTGNTGTTAALAGSGELAVVAVALLSGSGLANANISDPPSTGYVGPPSLNVAQNTSTGVGAELDYKTNATTTGEVATWTWSTDGSQKCWAACIAVFKPLIITPPPAMLEAPNRPRPGRGPYSLGQYFRPDFPAFFNPSKAFSYTMSGGLVFSGAAIENAVRSVVGSGGLVFGGTSAAIDKRTLTMTGGIVFGGTASAAVARAYTMSGGIVFGGSAAVSTHVSTFAYTMSGGIVFGGAAGVGFIIGGQTFQKMRRDLAVHDLTTKG